MRSCAFWGFRGSVVLALTLFILPWVGPTAAAAQGGEQASAFSRFSGALSLVNTQPLGALETGPGLGIGLSGAWAVDPARRFRLRGEVRVTGYGLESRRACLSETVGCLIEVDINTTYSTVYAGVGPEVAIPVMGSTLILDATAGYGRFSVDSSIEGLDGTESLLNTNNFHDDFFAWSAGGELRIAVSSQVALALGAHYQRNGVATYVPEGGVRRNADGSVTAETLTTDANQVALSLGVAFHPR